MKKLLTIILAVSAIMLTAAIILVPVKASSSLKPLNGASAAMPDTMMKIFQNSCMDCHATDGNAMAKSHINFTEWDKYSPQKQADKAMAACKMVSKDAMPPKGWRKNNADRVPTARQKKAICDWANSLNASK
jgi:cytochrome c5